MLIMGRIEQKQKKPSAGSTGLFEALDQRASRSGPEWAQRAAAICAGDLPRTALLWQIVTGRHGGRAERSSLPVTTLGCLSAVSACHAGHATAKVQEGGLT